MASVFWDAQGITFNNLLRAFEGQNHQKEATFGENFFFVSPRQCAMSQITENNFKKYKLGFELLLNQLYIPDMVPTNYHLFSKLKEMFCVNRFGSDKEVKINYSTRVALKSQKSIGMIVLAPKETILMNKENFCKKMLFYYLGLGLFDPCLF